jgi:hypothetical protein
MPCEVTRIVPRGPEAVFTVALEELVVDADGSDLLVVFVFVLLELLPHATSTNDRASKGTVSFSR